MEPTKNFKSIFCLHESTKGGDETMRYIRFEDGYAIATDAHIAIRADLRYITTFTNEEIERLNGKSIDAKSFKKILSYDSVNVLENGIEYNDDIAPAFFGFNRQLDIKFPEAQTAIEAALLEAEAPVKRTSLGINSSFLGKLAKAMGCTTLRLDFTISGKVLVRHATDTCHQEAIQGIIMPINIEDKDSKKSVEQ